MRRESVLRFLCIVIAHLPLGDARAAAAPTVVSLTRSGSMLTTSSTTAVGLPGDHLTVTAVADEGQIQLTLSDGAGMVITPNGLLGIGSMIMLNNGDSVSLTFPGASAYAFSIGSIGGSSSTNSVGLIVDISSATTTTIQNVQPEPSLPFHETDVTVQVTGVAVQPSIGSRVVVTGSDGSWSSCVITAGGLASCPLSFGTSGTVVLSASFVGDGVVDPSTSSGVAHTIVAPLTLIATQAAQVGVGWTLEVTGLAPSVSATVDFGDGSGPSQLLSDGSGHASTSHAFVQEGNYDVRVTDPVTPKQSDTLVAVFSTVPAATALSTGYLSAAAGVGSGTAAISAHLDQSLGGATSEALLSVGIYPTDPTGSWTEGAISSFDLRATNTTPSGSCDVTLTVPDGVVLPPVLSFFDPATHAYQPVLSSTRAVAPRYDPLAHTLSVTFDDSSTPTLASLAGTVLATHGTRVIPAMPVVMEVISCHHRRAVAVTLRDR